MNEPRTPTAGPRRGRLGPPARAVCAGSGPVRVPGEERGRETATHPPGARAANPGAASRPPGAPT